MVSNSGPLSRIRKATCIRVMIFSPAQRSDKISEQPASQQKLLTHVPEGEVLDISRVGVGLATAANHHRGPNGAALDQTDHVRGFLRRALAHHDLQTELGGAAGLGPLACNALKNPSAKSVRSRSLITSKPSALSSAR